MTLISDALGQKLHLQITAHALRSVEHRGGIDAFLLKARDSELSTRALRLKQTIAKKVEAARRPLHRSSRKEPSSGDAVQIGGRTVTAVNSLTPPAER